MIKTRSFVRAAVIVAAAVLAPTAWGVTPSSFAVFENSSSASLSGLSLSVNISQNAANTIDFVFGNASVAPNALASMDDIYFESTAYSALNLSAGAILSSTGSVSFVVGATPGSVPGGVNIGFAPSLFSVGRTGGAANGVGPGDTLTIRFNLAKPFATFVSDWSGDNSLLRIATHVQRLGTDGASSVSAVTAVPTPTGALALGVAGGLLSVRRRRGR